MNAVDLFHAIGYGCLAYAGVTLYAIFNIGHPKNGDKEATHQIALFVGTIVFCLSV